MTSASWWGRDLVRAQEFLVARLSALSSLRLPSNVTATHSPLVAVGHGPTLVGIDPHMSRRS